MKKSMLVAIAALVLVGTVAAAEVSSLSDEANMSRTANTADLFGTKWGFKMTRGLVNELLAGWNFPAASTRNPLTTPTSAPSKASSKAPS